MHFGGDDTDGRGAGLREALVLRACRRGDWRRGRRWCYRIYTVYYGLWTAGLGVSTSRIRIHGPGPLPPMGPRLAHLWHLSRAGAACDDLC